MFASAENSRRVKALHELVTHSKLLGHFPVVFGYLCGLLGLTPLQSVDLFLYGQLRNLVSAAVRMGLVGSVKVPEIAVDMSVGSVVEALLFAGTEIAERPSTSAPAAVPPVGFAAKYLFSSCMRFYCIETHS